MKFTPEKERAIRTEFPVIADGLGWLTVCGQIDLALRHPQNNGPSAQLARDFRDALRRKLLEVGVIDSDDLAVILRDQMTFEATK